MKMASKLRFLISFGFFLSKQTFIFIFPIIANSAENSKAVSSLPAGIGCSSFLKVHPFAKNSQKCPAVVFCMLKQHPLFGFLPIMWVCVCNQAFNRTAVVQNNPQVIPGAYFCGTHDAACDFCPKPFCVVPFIIMAAFHPVP